MIRHGTFNLCLDSFYEFGDLWLFKWRHRRSLIFILILYQELNLQICHCGQKIKVIAAIVPFFKLALISFLFFAQQCGTSEAFFPPIFLGLLALTI